MIRVLIADDHPIVRKGLRTILKDIPDIKVEDEAGDGLEVMEKIRNTDYDVIVLDLSMPKLDGFEAIKRIKAEKPEMAILILSMNPEEVFGIRALNLGASGTCRKILHSNSLYKQSEELHRARFLFRRCLPNPLHKI